MPRVSVLMPTYNTHERHLYEAIQSIRKQTFTDFELLILDNASTSIAKIREVVQSFADPRIQFSENESNLGISPSRNKLIRMAQGEYIAVHDSDDISVPDRLQKQVAFLDKNKDVGVVGGSILKMYRGKIITYPADNEVIEELLMLDCVIEHPLAMIRKSVLIDNNIFYEEEYTPSEDYALFCRLIGKIKFANIPDVLLHYRDHNMNTTSTQSKKMREATERLLNFVRTCHPSLWHQAQRHVISVNRYSLFGFLPLLSVRTQGKRTRYLLFDRLPLLQSKKAEVSSGITSHYVIRLQFAKFYRSLKNLATRYIRK